MATVFLKHEVADYEAWRSAYDADQPRRDAAGLSEIGVYRDASDGNTVLLAWRTSDLEAFTAMVESEELKAKMEEAGVTGPPDIWIGEKTD